MLKRQLKYDTDFLVYFTLDKEDLSPFNRDINGVWYLNNMFSFIESAHREKHRKKTLYCIYRSEFENLLKILHMKQFNNKLKDIINDK